MTDLRRSVISDPRERGADAVELDILARAICKVSCNSAALLRVRTRPSCGGRRSLSPVATITNRRDG
jgi:hypothetical protein